MALFLWIALGLILTYWLWIGLFFYGWRRTKACKGENIDKKPGISVVVAARNEEANITRLLDCLTKQEYPDEFFEVIVVDDHSSDSTPQLTASFTRQYKNVRYSRLPGSLIGKKSAIRLGVKLANFSFILTTDADCILSPGWIRAMGGCFLATDADLVAGPVLLNGNDDLVSKFQQMEHLSLQGSTAGAIKTGNPIMCSSANLGFTKEAYWAANDPGYDRISSGDDVFLLLAMHKMGRKIVFIPSADAWAETGVQAGMKSFLGQRKRWASKSLHYNTTASRFTALLVFIINFYPFACLLAGIFLPEFLLIAFFILVFKSLVDFPFLYCLTGYFRKRRLMAYFPLMQVLYMFYINYTVLTLLAGNIKWKGRSVRY